MVQTNLVYSTIRKLTFLLRALCNMKTLDATTPTRRIASIGTSMSIVSAMDIHLLCIHRLRRQRLPPSQRQKTLHLWPSEQPAYRLSRQ